MPRNWPTALQTELASPAAAVAILARVDRRDGVALGFTSWDEPLTFGSLTYTPDEGLKASAITSSVGAGNDDARVAVLMDVAAITEDDIKREVYKGAPYEVRVCLVADPNVNGILGRGYFGGMIIGQGRTDIEFKSLTSLLKRVRGDLFSKGCRCRRLGDLQCKVDLLGLVKGHPIMSAAMCVAQSGKEIVIDGGAPIAGFYSFGSVVVTSGPNANVARDVKTSSYAGGQTTIVLREALPFDFEDEFSVAMVAGCNRLLRTEAGVDATEGSTCADFGNENNFHGEWYLPGNSAVLTSAGTS